MFSIDMKSCNIPCNKCKYLYTYCYPCPLPALRNNGSINHATCIETLRRAKLASINLLGSRNFEVDCNAIIHKANSNKNFRMQLCEDYEATLKKNHFVLQEKDQGKLEKILAIIDQKVNDILRKEI